jgi:heat shock protein HslJ
MKEVRMRTPGSPAPALALLASLLAACEQSQPQSGSQTPGSSPSAASPANTALPPEALGVTWQWVSLTTPVERLSVDEPGRYTLRFEAGGRVALQADCNRGMGSYSVSADRHITFQPIALTRMMCPPGSMSDRFAREIGRATRYFLKESDLYLDLPVDSGTLRFRRQV